MEEAARWAAANARTRSLIAGSVMYSTGDLPSMRASNSAGSSAATRVSSRSEGSHVAWER